MSETSAATGAGESMKQEDWLHACLAWLDDAQMRASVVEHIEEAADALAALREENERLRKALAHYQCTCTTQCAHGMPVDMCGWEARRREGSAPMTDQEIIEAAARAIMLSEHCGCTIQGERVLCDDPRVHHAERPASCSCRDNAITAHAICAPAVRERCAEDARAELAQARAETEEQARLNGMGAERELALRAEIEHVIAERNRMVDRWEKQRFEIINLEDDIERLNQELAQARAQAMEEAAKERVRHKKRGSTYRVIGEAELQTSEPLPEGETVVVYQCETDGKLWARPDWEFHDGRFEALAPPAKGESE